MSASRRSLGARWLMVVLALVLAVAGAWLLRSEPTAASDPTRPRDADMPPNRMLQEMVDGMGQQWAAREPPVAWVERPLDDGARLLAWHGVRAAGQPEQHGVTLLRLQGGRVHVLAYVARSAEALAANEARWIAAFAAAPLTFPPW